MLAIQSVTHSSAGEILAATKMSGSSCKDRMLSCILWLRSMIRSLAVASPNKILSSPPGTSNHQNAIGLFPETSILSVTKLFPANHGYFLSWNWSTRYLFKTYPVLQCIASLYSTKPLQQFHLDPLRWEINPWIDLESPTWYSGQRFKCWDTTENQKQSNSIVMVGPLNPGM